VIGPLLRPLQLKAMRTDFMLRAGFQVVVLLLDRTPLREHDHQNSRRIATSDVPVIDVMYHTRELGSSVSKVSGYGLDDRAIEVRSPAEEKGFSSSLCVQTGSGTHPASCTMDTGVLSPG
jgi:hypothetical protein